MNANFIWIFLYIHTLFMSTAGILGMILDSSYGHPSVHTQFLCCFAHVHKTFAMVDCLMQNVCVIK